MQIRDSRDTVETHPRLTISPPMSIFSKDPENTEAADLQRKLEMLNNMMDQEARAEQARRQILYNIGHCKYSPSHCLSGCCFIRNNSSLRDTRGASPIDC